MINTPSGAEIDPNNPENQTDLYECSECGDTMETDSRQCSRKCFDASMR